MPLANHWALRGGFTPRANPGRPNIHFLRQEMFRQPCDEIFVSFYHRSQESTKMFDGMKQRVELAYEQRRKSEANRLKKDTNGSVLRYLERIPLSENVTLTIEVPNADHACMIERMEAWCDEDSIPQIMQDTGVLIQFPDLVPDVKNGNDYVNRITLTGSLENVEKARIRIRNFMPIAISFPLRTLKPNILIEDVKSIIERAIAEKLINFPNIEIMVQVPQMAKDADPSCTVRGTINHERDICNACAALHRLLFDARQDSEHDSEVIYLSEMDIPAVQQLAVTGIPDGYLIRTISSETNSVIYFPTVADRHFGATVFYLFGSVSAIIKARKYIQGLLPVRLIFDVDNNDLVCPVDVSNRELFLRDTEHDLTIMIKKSRLEGEQLTKNDTLRNMVIIESKEYNLTNVYAVRHQLLRSSVLENEPLITTRDFDFFKKEFKALIAKNNQVIAEDSNDSLAKASSLIYSRRNKNKKTSSLPAMPIISSPLLNGVATLLPQMHICQEMLRSRDGNAQNTASISNSSSSGVRTESAITFSSSSSSFVSKEQSASNGVNMSVPRFLDFFRQTENRNFLMFPVDNFGRSLSSVAVPQKVEHIRNINKASGGQNLDSEHLEKYNFDVIASNANYDLANSNASENISESKYFRENSSVYMQSFTHQSQDLMNSGANVIDALISDQGSTTAAVAAAMLQNSPPQWFQSSDTMEVLKSSEFSVPGLWKKATIPKTFPRRIESVQNSMASSPEKTWQTKKNLPLKSSFTNEIYIREFHREIGANKTRDMLQGLSARGSRETLSDFRLPPSTSNRNINPPYGVSYAGNATINKHRSLHRNSDNVDYTYNYRTEYQPKITRDSAVWENSRYSSSRPYHHYTHSNTRQIFSRKLQGLSSQNSSRSSDAARGGRIVRQSMNQCGGHCSSFSRSQSTWSLSSSSYSESRRYNQGMTNIFFKRQFVNGAQLNERRRGIRREERYHCFQQEQQRGCICNQLRTDPEELNTNNVASPRKLLVKTKTYADITEGFDIMLLISEAQKSHNEQSSRSVQQLNRPPLMMKELEKYTGNDDISSKSYTGATKKCLTKEDKVRSKTLVQDDSGSEQSPGKAGKDCQNDG